MSNAPPGIPQTRSSVSRRSGSVRTHDSTSSVQLLAAHLDACLMLFTYSQRSEQKTNFFPLHFLALVSLTSLFFFLPLQNKGPCIPPHVVNICMINDLSYPPATHPQIIKMQFFITRPTRPADITAIRASLPIHWQ